MVSAEAQPHPYSPGSYGASHLKVVSTPQPVVTEDSPLLGGGVYLPGISWVLCSMEERAAVSHEQPRLTTAEWWEPWPREGTWAGLQDPALCRSATGIQEFSPYHNLPAIC